MVKSSTPNAMVRVSCSIIMRKNTKAIGKMITSMASDSKHSLMGHSMKGSMLMANLKELENIYGLMGSYMRESGSMVSSMGQGCGREPKAIAMLVNGGWVRHKVVGCMYGLMVIVMKVNSKIV